MGSLAVSTPGRAHVLSTRQIPYLEPQIPLRHLFTVRPHSRLRNHYLIQRQLIQDGCFPGAGHPHQDYLKVLLCGEVAVQSGIDGRQILTHFKFNKLYNEVEFAGAVAVTCAELVVFVDPGQVQRRVTTVNGHFLVARLLSVALSAGAGPSRPPSIRGNTGRIAKHGAVRSYGQQSEFPTPSRITRSRPPGLSPRQKSTRHRTPLSQTRLCLRRILRHLSLAILLVR